MISPLAPKQVFKRNMSGISTAPFLKQASRKDLPPWFTAWKKEMTVYPSAEKGQPTHKIRKKSAQRSWDLPAGKNRPANRRLNSR